MMVPWGWLGGCATRELTMVEEGSAAVLTITHMNRCSVGFAEHSRNGIN